MCDLMQESRNNNRIVGGRDHPQRLAGERASRHLF